MALNRSNEDDMDVEIIEVIPLPTAATSSIPPQPPDLTAGTLYLGDEEEDEELDDDGRTLINAVGFLKILLSLLKERKNKKQMEGQAANWQDNLFIEALTDVSTKLEIIQRNFKEMQNREELLKKQMTLESEKCLQQINLSKEEGELKLKKTVEEREVQFKKKFERAKEKFTRTVKNCEQVAEEELSKVVKEKNEEINKLRGKLQIVREQYQQKSEELTEKEKNFNLKKEEYRVSEADLLKKMDLLIKSNEIHLVLHPRAMKEADEKYSKLEKESQEKLGAMEKEKERLAELLRNCEEKLSEIKKSQEKMQKENEQLLQELDKKNSKIEDKDKLLKEMGAVIKENHEHFTKKIKALEEQLRKKEQDLNCKSEEITNLQKLIAEKTETVTATEAQDRIQFLENQCQEAQQEIQQLKDSLVTVEGLRNKEQQDFQKDSQKISSLEKEVKALQLLREEDKLNAQVTVDQLSKKLQEMEVVYVTNQKQLEERNQQVILENDKEIQSIRESLTKQLEEKGLEAQEVVVKLKMSLEEKEKLLLAKETELSQNTLEGNRRVSDLEATLKAVECQRQKEKEDYLKELDQKLGGFQAANVTLKEDLQKIELQLKEMAVVHEFNLQKQSQQASIRFQKEMDEKMKKVSKDKDEEILKVKRTLQAENSNVSVKLQNAEKQLKEKEVIFQRHQEEFLLFQTNEEALKEELSKAGKKIEDVQAENAVNLQKTQDSQKHSEFLEKKMKEMELEYASKVEKSDADSLKCRMELEAKIKNIQEEKLSENLKVQGSLQSENDSLSAKLQNAEKQLIKMEAVLKQFQDYKEKFQRNEDLNGELSKTLQNLETEKLANIERLQKLEESVQKLTKNNEDLHGQLEFEKVINESTLECNQKELSEANERAIAAVKHATELTDYILKLKEELQPHGIFLTGDDEESSGNNEGDTSVPSEILNGTRGRTLDEEEAASNCIPIDEFGVVKDKLDMTMEVEVEETTKNGVHQESSASTSTSSRQSSISTEEPSTSSAFASPSKGTNETSKTSKEQTRKSRRMSIKRKLTT